MALEGGSARANTGLAGKLAEKYADALKKIFDVNEAYISIDAESAGIVEYLNENLETPEHATTHENGGTDEINVDGLSGTLADPQTPDAHKSTHENTGSDEISVAGLSGELADPQPPKTHASTHQNTGSDEINVAGLSGTLADEQKVTVRKNTGSNVGTRQRLNFIEGSNVTLTIADDSGSNEIDITIASSISDQIMIVNDERNPGTNGGSVSIGWNDRVLNTIKRNTISGASLSSNQITLPAGDYYIDAMSCHYQPSSVTELFIALRLTDGTVIVNGLNASLEDTGVNPLLKGYFSIATSTVYKLSLYSKISYSTYGLGRAVGLSGRNEIYSTVFIRKLT